MTSRTKAERAMDLANEELRRVLREVPHNRRAVRVAEHAADKARRAVSTERAKGR